MNKPPFGQSATWALRYAPHVGYLPPFHPLFRHIAGGSGLEGQIDFIARQGFAGVLHPWVAAQPPEARRAFAALLKDHGLDAGCIVYTGLEQIMRPLWVSGTGQDRRDLLAQIDMAADAAAEVGSRVIAVLIVENPDDSHDAQVAKLRDNLRFAADVASTREVVLGIEPMLALPGMLFQTAGAAADVLREVAHPAAWLIFDTAHIARMEGDILAAQTRLADLVCLYQLADTPDRTEPGSGTIDFVALLTRLMQEGYTGLVELEHGWSAEGADVERDGLAALRDIDARAAQAANRLAHQFSGK